MPKGDWMQTIGGRKFWPLDPQAEDLNLMDISHSLSQTARFAGHVPKLYSVAQHSVILSRYVDRELAPWALMHDAAEAYIGDLVRPVKRSIPQYREIERGILRLIAKRYRLPGELPPLALTDIDYALCVYEAQSFGHSTDEWVQPRKDYLEGFGEPNLFAWSEEDSRREFRRELEKLNIKEPGNA